MLICTDSCPPSELLAAWLREVLPVGGKMDLVTADRRAEDLRERAGDGTYDLCLLTLNNIVFPSGNHPIETRMVQAVRLVRDLRTAHHMPIICFTGWIEDSELPTRVRDAGAQCFFTLPVSTEDIKDALHQCLKLG